MQKGFPLNCLILGTKKEASLRFYFRKPASYQIFNYFPMIYRKKTYTARITYTGIMMLPIRAPMMTLNAAIPSVAVISIPFGIRISRILCIPNGSPERNIHQNKSVFPLTFMIVDTIQNQNSINASGNIDFLITSSIIIFSFLLSNFAYHIIVFLPMMLGA